MKQGIFKLGLLFLALAATSLAQAIPVNLSVQGTINMARNTNPYNVSVGDNVIATATFDDSLIAASGDSFIDFGAMGNAFGGTLSLMIGTRTFSESDDNDFLTDLFPSISFSNGLFDGFDFLTDFGNNGSRTFESFDLSFLGVNNNNGRTQISGEWDANSATISPASVPEPSSMMLLGLGVIGLISAKRKKYS